MCFIISVVGLVLAFNFFMAHNYLLGFGSLSVSALFIYLMISNIKKVKKMREEKKDDH